MIVGLCVGVVDEKIGPMPIYYKNLNKELTQKIVMKVMVGVMSFSAETTEENMTGESIIPFIKESLIAFAYLFPLKDQKARGGLRQCSIILAFNEADRVSLYTNAKKLSEELEEISKTITTKHVQSKELSNAAKKGLEEVLSSSFNNLFEYESKEETNIRVVCPICSKESEISVPRDLKGTKFIEHTIKKGEVCDHTFIIYFDSKFNILGYKDPEVELKEMKKLFKKLKSPYD